MRGALAVPFPSVVWACQVTANGSNNTNDGTTLLNASYTYATFATHSGDYTDNTSYSRVVSWATNYSWSEHGSYSGGGYTIGSFTGDSAGTMTTNSRSTATDVQHDSLSATYEQHLRVSQTAPGSSGVSWQDSEASGTASGTTNQTETYAGTSTENGTLHLAGSYANDQWTLSNIQQDVQGSRSFTDNITLSDSASASGGSSIDLGSTSNYSQPFGWWAARTSSRTQTFSAGNSSQTVSNTTGTETTHYQQQGRYANGEYDIDHFTSNGSTTTHNSTQSSGTSSATNSLSNNGWLASTSPTYDMSANGTHSEMTVSATTSIVGGTTDTAETYHEDGSDIGGKHQINNAVYDRTETDSTTISATVLASQGVSDQSSYQWTVYADGGNVYSTDGTTTSSLLTSLILSSGTVNGKHSIHAEGYCQGNNWTITNAVWDDSETDSDQEQVTQSALQNTSRHSTLTAPDRSYVLDETRTQTDSVSGLDSKTTTTNSLEQGHYSNLVWTLDSIMWSVSSSTNYQRNENQGSSGHIFTNMTLPNNTSVLRDDWSSSSFVTHAQGQSQASAQATGSMVNGVYRIDNFTSNFSSSDSTSGISNGSTTTHVVKNGNDITDTTTTTHDENSGSTTETRAEQGGYQGNAGMGPGALLTVSGFDPGWSITAMADSIASASKDVYHEEGTTHQTRPLSEMNGSYTLDRSSNGTSTLEMHGSYSGGAWTLDVYRYDEEENGKGEFHGIVDWTYTLPAGTGGTDGGSGSGGDIICHVHRTIDEKQTADNWRRDRGSFVNGAFVLTEYFQHYRTTDQFESDEVGTGLFNWELYRLKSETIDLIKSGSGTVGIDSGTYIRNDNLYQHSEYTVGGFTIPWTDSSSTPTSGTFLMTPFTLQDRGLGAPANKQKVNNPAMMAYDPNLQKEIAEINKLDFNGDPLGALETTLRYTMYVGIGTLAVGGWVVGIATCGVWGTLAVAGMGGDFGAVFEGGREIAQMVDGTRKPWDFDLGAIGAAGLEGLALGPMFTYVPGMQYAAEAMMLWSAASELADGHWMTAAWDAMGATFLELLVEAARAKFCWAGDQLVFAGRGWIRWDELTNRDRVWCRDENNSEAPLVLKQVEEVFKGEAEITCARASGKDLRTTALHRIFVLGKGWMTVENLVRGDRFIGHDGRTSVVEKVEHTALVEPVYNCRVADYHTYFVRPPGGEFDVWAHNECQSSLQYESKVAQEYKGIERAQKQTFKDGQGNDRIPDGVYDIQGVDTVVEAKWVRNGWENSPRNPASPAGKGEFGNRLQWEMIEQAQRYSAAYEQVRYHSNSQEFIDFYAEFFQTIGLGNITFIYTAA